MPAQIDRDSLDRLFRRSYEKLLRAAEHLIIDNKTADFEPAELVNQAFIDLAKNRGEAVVPSGGVTRATVVERMRLILSGAQRESKPLRRGDPSRASTPLEIAYAFRDDLAASHFGDALGALRELFPDAESLILAKLHGLSDQEIAEDRGISGDQVQREWEFTILWLQRELGMPLGSSRKPLTSAGEAKYQFLNTHNGHSLLRLFFATDRRSVPSDTGIHYSYERSPEGLLNFGESEVSIPRSHAKGKRESNKSGLFTRSPDPARHMILNQVREMPQGDFFAELAKAIDASRARDAFVFVHGYNVSFEDAVRGAAQLAFDLEMRCAPILYSWPSNGRLLDYTRDENEIIWTVAHFEQFLLLLTQLSGAERIHIIAHSMGNRAVCDALKSLGQLTGLPIRLNHLVLAAADIDSGVFTQHVGTLKRIANRVTLYQSANDRALRISKGIHRYPRAGDPVLVVNGVDTIDASDVETDSLGHSYFSQSRELLADIHSTIFKDEPPYLRFGLMEMEHPEGKYYAFRP